MGRCDQNLDQGSKICSNFKVLRMRRKQCHYVCLVLLILAVYLLSQTESVWRSYRDLFVEPNRKKFDADWAGRTADMAGRTADVGDRTMTWKLMMWRPCWRGKFWLVVNGRIMLWHMALLWTNGRVPRGPIMGHHVAPLYWLMDFWFIKNCWWPRGSTPGPPTLQWLIKFH